MSLQLPKRLTIVEFSQFLCYLFCYKLNRMTLLNKSGLMKMLNQKSEIIILCIVINWFCITHNKSLTLPLYIYGPVEDRNVSGHVFVCQGYRLCLFLWFWYLILELFRYCAILLLFFLYSINIHYKFWSDYVWLNRGLRGSRVSIMFH